MNKTLSEFTLRNTIETFKSNEITFEDLLFIMEDFYNEKTVKSPFFTDIDYVRYKVFKELKGIYVRENQKFAELFLKWNYYLDQQINNLIVQSLKSYAGENHIVDLIEGGKVNYCGKSVLNSLMYNNIMDYDNFKCSVVDDVVYDVRKILGEVVKSEGLAS